LLALAGKTSVLDHPFIARLVEFGLDRDDFVLFGSAPMLAHGLRKSIRDLDVVARGSAWQHALTHGTPGVGVVSGDPVMHLWGDRIQFSKGWISPSWDADELIDHAEIIEGIRFARLAEVLAYKRVLSRPKDIADIQQILRSTRIRDHRSESQIQFLGGSRF
jgi:methylase of polypeptide subunit release factors